VVDLDLGRPAVAGSARLLLCTDGLTAQADEAETAGVLAAFADPDQAAVELVRLANRNGGDDNSAVVVDISPQRVSRVQWAVQPP
jgi:protein phosphatase